MMKRFQRAAGLCMDYNNTREDQPDARRRLLEQLLGKNLSVKPGFQCDMGINIHVGDGVLTNYNVTILDMATVTIGDNVWLGPNVGIYAVAHPMDAAGRVQRQGIARPITIGNNVWIGGGATVLRGVTIGNNVVIGAGSVVTKDIPDNAVAAGNPARIIRYIDNTTCCPLTGADARQQSPDCDFMRPRLYRGMRQTGGPGGLSDLKTSGYGIAKDEIWSFLPAGFPTKRETLTDLLLEKEVSVRVSLFVGAGLVGPTDLQALQHTLDDHLGRNLPVGGFGYDERIGALDDIIGHNEAASYGQTVHELSVVGDGHVGCVDGP